MTGRSHPKKVGLKYCGGCRARYDRVEAVGSIRRRLEGVAELIAPESEDAEMILIVTGCPSACASRNFEGGRMIRYVTSPEDIEQWMKEMLTLKPRR